MDMGYLDREIYSMLRLDDYDVLYGFMFMEPYMDDPSCIDCGVGLTTEGEFCADCSSRFVE